MNIELIQKIISLLKEIIWGIPLVLILIITHVYFTFYLKFPQKNILKGIQLIFKSKNEKGINSFKSIMTVLASTIGIGNIVGVTTAITIGGIGSIFWIFISSIFAISTKYIETYLALKYRYKKNNSYIGGTMFILNDIGFNKLALFFSILLIMISFGSSMIQSNSITNYFVNNINIDKNIIGIIITFFCSYVMFGNEKRISKISSILLPIAIIIYILMCFFIILIFKNNLFNVILEIINCAFNPTSISGGIVGISIIKIITIGMSRGLFSNESGMGTSPLFNINVESNNTIKDEAIIASTSVFIDTTIVCTLTGIVIAITNIKLSNPIELINEVFAYIPYGNYLLLVCLIIFGITSIPCLGYYGSLGIKYIFKNKKIYLILYKFFYIIVLFIGSILESKIIWDIAIISNGLIIIPNLFMIYKLKEEVKIDS